MISGHEGFLYQSETDEFDGLTITRSLIYVDTGSVFMVGLYTGMGSWSDNEESIARAMTEFNRTEITAKPKLPKTAAGLYL